MINPEKIQEIVQKIVQNYDPDKIILFGSHARGDVHKDSDLDFIIVKQTDTPNPYRSVDIRKFLFGIMVPMDIKVYTPDEFTTYSSSRYSFLTNALKTSILLYERKG
jgi:predicted nucleotidyltransferase